MTEERGTFAKTVVIGLAVIAIGVAAIVWGIVALNKIDRTPSETASTVTNGELTTTETTVTTDISTTETGIVETVVIPEYVKYAREYSRFTGEYLNFLNSIVFESDLNQRAINNEPLSIEEEVTYNLWRIKTREAILLTEFLKEKGGIH